MSDEYSKGYTTIYPTKQAPEKPKHEGLIKFVKRIKEKNVHWVINLTLPEDLKEQAIALCKHEKISLAKLFYYLLWKEFNEKSTYC